MSMMGSSPGTPGISFEEVISLFKNEPAYQAKLREMQKRTEEARAVMTQATAISAKAEEAKAITAALAKEAEQHVIEARGLKEAAEKQANAAAKLEKDLAAEHEDRSRLVTEQKMQADLQVHNAHIASTKEIALKEQQFQTDVKEFEARQADENARQEAFDAFKRSKEADLAKRDAALKEAFAEADLARAQSQELRRELTEKLKKIKSITAG